MARLRRSIAVVKRGKEAAKERDQAIARLKLEINPATGRLWTWPQIAALSGLSRIGVIDASKRALQDQQDVN